MGGASGTDLTFGALLPDGNPAETLRSDGTICLNLTTSGSPSAHPDRFFEEVIAGFTDGRITQDLPFERLERMASLEALARYMKEASEYLGHPLLFKRPDIPNELLSAKMSGRIRTSAL